MTYKNYLLPLVFIITIFFHACGPSATITVVEDTPRTTPADTDPLDNGLDFHQLTLGMIDPVTNFDPLFADNLSTMRVLSLVYQGLYTLNSQGEPVQALARDIEISDDGLEYLITINREIFYHDSELFTSGLGRRIHADDVKWAFERTAQMHVPESASKLLKNIAGYENYFLEQRTIYDEDKRVLDGVNGIQVVSPNTIRFVLHEADPDFLEKLASPYLYIYPREISQQPGNPLKQNPVGTGTYFFRGMDEDSTITLVHNSPEEHNYTINRIDIVHQFRERDLFQSFARHEIDWIPEAGPQTFRQVFSDGDDLSISSSYSEEFRVTEHNAFRISSVYVNQNTTAELSWFLNRLSEVTVSDFSIRGEYHLQPQRQTETDSEAEPASDYFVPFTDDKIAHNLLSDLQSAVIQPESNLVFFEARVTTPSSVLFCRNGDSFHTKWDPLPDDYWLQLKRPIFSLYQAHLSGIEPVSVPWLLVLDNIRLNQSQRTSL